jgi:amphi-Trp domain-containing protein
MANQNSTAPGATSDVRSEPPVSLVPEDGERARDKIKFKQVLGREEVAVYLDAIVRGLRKGQIEFRRADESLELRPGREVHLSLKASEKSKGGKLSIELVWSESSRVSLEVSS